MAHISMIPDELLGRCFVEAVNPIGRRELRDDDFQRYRKHRVTGPDYDALKTITLVGRHFREVAISHTFLWAYLSNSYTVGWNKLLIERSGEHELVVDVGDVEKLEKPEDSTSPDKPEEPPSPKFLLDEVLLELHRVVYLRVQVGSDDAAIIDHPIFKTAAPNLETFVCGESTTEAFRHFSSPLFAGDCPKLSVLHLVGYNILTSSVQTTLASANISSISLSNFPFQEWPSCRELLDLLRLCKGVRFLHLMKAGPRNAKDGETGLLALTRLPALESLAIDYRAQAPFLQAARDFMHHIQAPILSHLLLSHHIGPAAFDDFNQIVARDICPVTDIKDLVFSYPSFLILSFEVGSAETTSPSGLGDRRQRFAISYKLLSGFQRTDLSKLALSAISSWGIPYINTITILLTNAFVKTESYSYSPRIPNPQQLLGKFPNLKSCRLVGDGRKTDAERAMDFVEALRNKACDMASEGETRNWQFTDLRLHRIVVNDKLEAALCNFQDSAKSAGMVIRCWINNRLMHRKN